MNVDMSHTLIPNMLFTEGELHVAGSNPAALKLESGFRNMRYENAATISISSMANSASYICIFAQFFAAWLAITPLSWYTMAAMAMIRSAAAAANGSHDSMLLLKPAAEVRGGIVEVLVELVVEVVVEVEVEVVDVVVEVVVLVLDVELSNVVEVEVVDVVVDVVVEVVVEVVVVVDVLVL